MPGKRGGAGWGGVAFITISLVQAFYELLQCKRLLAANTDVEPYMVDGINYLAQTRIPR